MKTVIAIDGPAASGKSSVSRQIALRLHFAYVNSGIFYRAVTWLVMEKGLDPSAAEVVGDFVAESDLSSGFDDGVAFIKVNGENPLSHLHDDAVNRNVSAVSRVPAVRECIVSHLHRLAGERDVVMEGRDIGSVVFPDTPYKFYIDASPEVRKQRRQAQGQQDEIAVRDRIDSSRPTAPLIIAEDALVIDSTHLTIDGVVGEVIGRLKISGLQVPER